MSDILSNSTIMEIAVGIASGQRIILKHLANEEVRVAIERDMYAKANQLAGSGHVDAANMLRLIHGHMTRPEP